jgi:hypothetical protein
MTRAGTTPARALLFAASVKLLLSAGLPFDTAVATSWLRRFLCYFLTHSPNCSATSTGSAGLAKCRSNPASAARSRWSGSLLPVTVASTGGCAGPCSRSRLASW